MPSQMNAKRYDRLIYLLALVLLFSTLAPCSLIELAAESLGTEEPVSVDYASEEGAATEESADESVAMEEAGLVHLDCCAGCLTCCASYVETPSLGPLALAGVTKLSGFFIEQRPLGSTLSIWHPPRS